jgi:GNAT superfamily N-acetyltransferase
MSRLSGQMESLILSNREHIGVWADIINDAYDDMHYTEEQAENFFTNHLFLQNLETFLLKIGGSYVATISIGGYKENIQIGGVCRIAVKKAYQGRGIEKLLILYGYAKLKERGIKYGESLIASKRNVSMMAHFGLGFKPQYDMKYISYKGALKNVNSIQKYRLRKRLQNNYKKYLENFNNNYIKI